MKKNQFILLSAFFITALFSNCSIIPEENIVPSPTIDNPVEEFTQDESPESYTLSTFVASLSNTQLITFPWGYDRDSNKSRKYPVVVCGCWDEILNFNEDKQKKYPAFYIDYNWYSEEIDGENLSDFIDVLISQGCRIDLNRVYLTGFSAGGSGSFRISRGMVKKGKILAAIIRQAGQSETMLDDAAMKKTSVWYHIGLQDDAARITVARDTYTYFKNYSGNAAAVETTISDTLVSFNRTTKTLTLNGIEIVKYSEYPEVGHWSPCYNDQEIYNWLFNQSLILR